MLVTQSRSFCWLQPQGQGVASRKMSTMFSKYSIAEELKGRRLPSNPSQLCKRLEASRAAVVLNLGVNDPFTGVTYQTFTSQFIVVAKLQL